MSYYCNKAVLNTKKIESIEEVKLKIYKVKQIKNKKNILIFILSFIKNSRKIVNATGIKNLIEIKQLIPKIENIFCVNISKVNIDSIFLR